MWGIPFQNWLHRTTTGLPNRGVFCKTRARAAHLDGIQLMWLMALLDLLHHTTTGLPNRGVFCKTRARAAHLDGIQLMRVMAFLELMHRTIVGQSLSFRCSSWRCSWFLGPH